MRPPMYWLSFADPESGELIGACSVVGFTPDDALDRSWELGFNPGGDVRILGPYDPNIADCPDELKSERFLDAEYLLNHEHDYAHKEDM